MAAGLGFKTFTTGEVLTAADTNGYLMQGVLVFDDATARDAAITSPQEGQFAYLKDTDVTTYYTSSAWANLDTTGMTNPMTTTADMIYSSSGSTPARLGIGTAGQVLQVNAGATAPEWAAPAAGGGKVLQVVHSDTSTLVSNSTNVQADTTLTATITPSAATSKILVLVTHNSNYKSNGAGGNNNAVILKLYRGATEIGKTGGVNFISPGASPLIDSVLSSAGFNVLDTPNTTSATTYKTMFHAANAGPAVAVQQSFGGQWDSTSYITLLEIGA
jgi:hypothetical protein